MMGNKRTFKDGKMFYKEYSKNEFYFLKMLHGENNLHLDTIIKDGIQYIEMPLGHVISIDTITKNERNSICIRNIILDNIPFMLKQITLLNNLGIYYSDAMQWLYYENKMYLIDFDVAYMTTIDYNYNNFDLFLNFLNAFNINCDYITESLYYLNLFKNGIEYSLIDIDKEIKKQYDESINYRHVYYSKNLRHIQINNIKYSHIYGKNGNMILTENILNPDIVENWEFLKIV